VGLFRRRSKAAPSAGPAPEETRGRAAEIADAGDLGWEVLWEALKTEPPAEGSSTIAQELGLGEEREVSQDTSDMPATEFAGTRNGRLVALRMGVVPSAWRGRGVYEVELEAPVAPFRARADTGRFIVEPGAAPEVEEFLSALAPAPGVWDEVGLEVGPMASSRAGR
jgi:hypothetical protein